MKKIFLMLFLVLFFAGCATGADGDDVVLITERFFSNQMQEIFLNHQQYLGSSVQYEGMFRTIVTRDGDEFFMVYRYSIGCCGEEIMGLEVDMNGLAIFPDNAWVEVRGVLDMDDGFLVLRPTWINEMNERGLELVQ